VNGFRRRPLTLVTSDAPTATSRTPWHSHCGVGTGSARPYRCEPPRHHPGGRSFYFEHQPEPNHVRDSPLSRRGADMPKSTRMTRSGHSLVPIKDRARNQSGDLTNVWGRHHKAMNSPVTSVTGLGHIDEQSSRDSSFGGKLIAKQFGTFSTASTQCGHFHSIKKRTNRAGRKLDLS
jgi:hypothetical protein